MDKNTLSQYGWSVVLILVLVIMVTLASPFGSFVKDSALGGTRSFVNLTYTALGMDIPLDEAQGCFRVDSAGVLSINPKYSLNAAGMANVCKTAKDEGFPSIKEFAKYAMYGLEIDYSIMSKSYNEFKALNITDKKFNEELISTLDMPTNEELAEAFPGYSPDSAFLALIYSEELYDYDDDYPDECCFPEITGGPYTADEILNTYIKPGIRKMAETELNDITPAEKNGICLSTLASTLDIDYDSFPEDIDYTNINEVEKFCKKTLGIDDPSALDFYKSFIHFYFDVDNLTIDDVMLIIDGYEYSAMYHAVSGDFSWDKHAFPAFNQGYYNAFGTNSLEYLETIYKNNGYLLPSAFAIPETINGITVTTIPNRLFDDYDYITAIQLPATVTNIGEWAFEDCSNLMQINLQNVKEINIYAFKGCKSLKKVNLSSLTSLEYDAFESCESLEDVKLSNNLTEIRNNTFYGCKALTLIEIPSSITYIGYNAFSGCCNGDSSKFIIKGTPGSYAESYAKSNYYAFVAA